MAKFVRVSRPHGHFTVPAATAERGGWTVLKRDAVDKNGRPLPPKLRESVEDAAKAPKRRRKKAAPKLRVDTAAATPTTETAADATGSDSEE